MLKLKSGSSKLTSSPAETRARLALLAAEILEVRPFLIVDYNAEKFSAELAPGLFGTWFWGGPQRLGMIPVHRDDRQRVIETRSLSALTAVGVGHDGRLEGYRAPWLHVDAIDVPEAEALSANLAVLAPLHARLLDVWSRIDLSRIYGRVRSDASGARAGEAPTQEEVTATLAMTETSEVEPTAPSIAAVVNEPPTPTASTVRLPTLRLERFLSILERLGCEVRQGKGSEVVAYRRGGKIAVIGRHTRNRQVPSTLVQRVLHQVGVTLTEWVKVLER